MGAAGSRWKVNAAEKKVQAEMDKDDKTCGKFYTRYTKHKHSGGVVAAWCPHGICVGFHIIPQAEGRNDIFSALFTRWEKPPRTVIYDFACQLATYCRIREAEFFKDTLFVIDQFHSKNHTSCSEACFLNPYMQQDLSLRMINSSTAECGKCGSRQSSQDRQLCYTINSNRGQQSLPIPAQSPVDYQTLLRYASLSQSKCSIGAGSDTGGDGDIALDEGRASEERQAPHFGDCPRSRRRTERDKQTSCNH
jgi:hypothetical protein